VNSPRNPAEGDFWPDFPPHWKMSQESASESRAVVRTLSDMIARIWHGYTNDAYAEAYASSVKAEILPGIANVPGYRGTFLLRRRCGNEVEFTTMMLWDSLEAVREFAGPDYEQAIVPVERRRLLSHFDERSEHYEILMQPGAANACSDA
jgi:heme-degrading monooxygenase HmoA